MAELLGTDEFLVNRDDVTYTQEQETLMATLQDTDHLLVNRAGQTYKITGEDLINSVIDPLEVTVVLAPTDGYTDIEVTAVPVVSGGKQPDGGYIFTYQWVTADDAAGTNKANIVGATEATFTPDNPQVGLFLGCVVSTTDALGTTAEGEAYIGPIQVLAQAPVIADVTVSELYDGSNRFTSKEFPYVTTMAVDGEPAPTYEVKGKLSGTTFDFDVISDKITEVDPGGIKTCETDTISSIDTTGYTPESGTYAKVSGSDADNPGEDPFANIENAWDGDDSTWTYFNYPSYSGSGSDSSRYSWVFNVPIPCTELKALVASYSADSRTFVGFNGQPGKQGADKNSGPPALVDFSDSITDGFLRSFEIGDVGSNYGLLYAVYVDGKVLVNPFTYPVLEFPSSNGFSCFKPGDVVQGIQWTFDNITENDWIKPFDGTNDYPVQLGAGGYTWFLNGGSAQYSGNLEFWDYISGATGNIEIYGLDNETLLETVNMPTDYGVWRVSSTPIENVGKVVYIGDYGWSRTKAGGVEILYTDFPTKVKVVSKDADANTITVNGGDWRTSGEQPLWSSTEFCTSGAEGNGAYSSDRAFNGETAGEQIWYPPNGGPSAKFETGDLFNSAAQLTVMYGKAGSGQIILNGTNVTADWSNGTDVEKTVALSSGFQSLEFTYPSSGNYVSLAWIKIDGVLLQDGSAGDSKLVKETPYNAKLTLASNENFELLEGIETFMTDNSTPITQTPYKLTTTTIETAESSLPVMSIVPTYVGYAGLWEEESAGGFDSATSAGGYSEFSTNGPVTFTFNPPIPGSSIQYLKGGGPSSGSPVKYSINGGGEFGNFVTSSGWADPAIDLGLQNETISTITFEHNDSGTWGGFYVINFYSSDKSTYLPAKNNVLVFSGDVSTNPDLQYFQAGDLLQGGFTYDMGGGTATASFTSTNGNSIDVIMDGIVDNTNNRVLASAGDMPGTVTCIPTNPVPAGAQISLVFALGNIPNSFTYSDAITLTAINGTPITPLRFDQVLESTLNFNSVFGVWKFPEGVNATSFTFQISDQIGGNNPVIWGFAVEEIPPATVISTGYPDSNTMLVSGGEWDNSNQSEVWSSLTTLTGATTPGQNQEAFYDNVAEQDPGQTPDNYVRINNGYLELTHSFTDVTSIEVSTSYQNGDVFFQYNNEAQQAMPGSASVSYPRLAMPTPPPNLNKIRFSTDSTGVLYLSKIWINGRPLVDKADMSQSFASNASDNIQPGTQINGFDGDFSTVMSTPIGTAHVEMNPPLQNVTEVKWARGAGNWGSGDYLWAEDSDGTKYEVQQSGDEISVIIPDKTIVKLGCRPVGGIATVSMWAKTYVNDLALIDPSARDYGDTHVEYQTNGGQGSVIEVNTTDNTLLVTNSGDGDNRWIAENIAGTDFYVAPSNPVPISQDHAWCKLQIVNNMAQVTGIQKDDPGYLPVPSKDYTIKFPTVFPTGNEPDDDLPRGTCVAAIVAAENSEGRSVKESNCFMPADVNPEDAAGPITDSTPTTLTVATNANLSKFSPGDNLVMVDENNEIANYTIQTSDIQSVDTALIEGVAQDAFIEGYENGAVDANVNGIMNAAIDVRPQLDAAGVTAITGFWLGYVGSNHTDFGQRDYSANLLRFDLIGTGWNVAQGDIRDLVALDSVVGEAYFSDNYALEPWWNKTNANNPQGQPPGGAYATTIAADDEIYGVKFATPVTRSIGSQAGIDFRVGTYCDLNLSTNVEKANSTSAIGIWDQDGNKVILFGKDESKVNLTLATTQDLKYFRTGDVVQEGTTPVDEEVSQQDVTDWFDQRGITQLTGMKVTNILAGTPGDLGYGATIRHKILIDSSEPTFTNIVDEGTVYSGRSFAGYLNATNTNYAQGESAEYSCSFDPVSRPIGTYIQMGWKTEYGSLVGSSFVKDQNGVWHRLNEVTDDIKIVSIDDTAPSITVDGGKWDASNQSEVWSDPSNFTTSSSFIEAYPISNAFDGDLNTSIYVELQNSTITWDASSFGLSGTVRVRPGATDPSSTYTITVNGSAVGTSADFWSDPVTVDSLSSISVTGISADGQLCAIEVNGKLLVDAQLNSEVWSTKVDTTEDPANPYSQIFDGDGGSLNPGGMPVPGTLLATWTPDTPIVFTDKVVFKGSNGSVGGAGPVITVDGVRTDYTNDNPGGASFEVEVSGGGTLESIEWGYPQTTVYTYWSCLFIDGKEVVDKGARDLGESVVTYGPVTGTGVFQSADLNANTMTLSVSNDRWIDTGNRLSKDFYVRDNITVLNADNVKHVAMQQAIADAFDAFPEKVNERRTAIASSFYRLMEGQALSAADYSLLEETVLDAVNAQEPFALDGYYPLYYTADKADAASSTDSHHTHNINGTPYYMPDGGTLYHGNYTS